MIEYIYVVLTIYFAKRGYFAKFGGGVFVSIKLFEHNKTAYEFVVAELAETDKATTFHSAGTGKSFTGFQLCEYNLNKTFFRLYPSKYIFRMQLENLKKTVTEFLQNLKFFMYDKLSYISDEKFSELLPDYIILDEFHRSGAEIWGSSVSTFSNIYINTPILGLLATNISYPYNKPDMAEKLVDENIASEMTLG